jgi:hypothetical protein
MREDVEGNFAADRVGETVVGEFLLQDLDEVGSNVVFLWVKMSEPWRIVGSEINLVVRLELIPFGNTASNKSG